MQCAINYTFLHSKFYAKQVPPSLPHFRIGNSLHLSTALNIHSPCFFHHEFCLGWPLCITDL